MSTDPFEPLMTFKPRIAGKRSEADPHRVPLLRVALKRRLQAAAKQKQPAGEKRRSGIAGVAEPNALSRRCLVKAHYVPMNGGGRDAARLHLDYLERDGVERDGSPGVLYGADDTFDRDGFGEELPGERRQFRFIVSPEDAGELDLHAFARELMARMSEDLGQPLLWAAVNHHNTEHPHVHIVVRGVDAAGKDVRVPRVYISRDMRWRAQEIATRELGLRSEHDIARQRSAEVTQERVTSLDRRLAELAGTGTEVRARRSRQAAWARTRASPRPPPRPQRPCPRSARLHWRMDLHRGLDAIACVLFPSAATSSRGCTTSPAATSAATVWAASQT